MAINPLKEFSESVGNIAGDFYEKVKGPPSAEEIQRKKCIAEGGKWDSVNKRCIMPEPTPEPLQQQQQETPKSISEMEQPTLTQPEIIFDEETGERKGIKFPDGRTYLGLSIEDQNLLLGKYQEKTALPAGTARAGTARLALEDTQRKLALASQVGYIDMATAQQAEELGINWKEAILSGVSGVIPSLATGAIAGAVAGSPTGVGAPIGAVAGAAGGAVVGLYKGVNANIKAQNADLLSGKTTELSKRTKALNNYISAANTNPAGAEDMLKAYQVEKSLIRKDYNTLMKKANEDLSYWNGQDGTSQLIAYEVYFESVEPSLDLKMEQAILKPDPTRAYINVEDFE